MRLLLSSLAIVLLITTTGLAFADAPVTVPDVTTESISYLTQMNYSQDFGQKAIDWISFGTDNPTWGDKSLLSVISLSLNAIALAMMAWLAVIGGATYIFQTANKGVPGGQVISSFWAPIRISTATILLIPLSSGYSTLQYGVITIAEKGNAHGSYLMGKGLDYLYDFGAYRAPGIPDGRAVIFSLIESEVCRQFINSFTKSENTITTVFTHAQRKNDLTLESKVAYRYNETSSSPTANDPRLDYCGAVAFTIEHDEDDGPSREKWLGDGFFIDADELTAHYGGPPIIAEGQGKLLQQAQKSAAEIAGMILSDEKALRDLQAFGESQQSTYERAVSELNGKISTAAKLTQSAIATYNSGSQKLIAQTVSKLNDQKNLNDGSSGGWRDQTKELGWMGLGTIFWQINISQSEINKLASTFNATITPPNPDKEWLADDRFVEMSMRISGLKKQFGTIEKITANDKEKYDANQSLGQPEIIPSLSAISDAGAEGDGWVDNTKSALYAAVAGTVRSALFKNSPDDLIINMQYFGSAMSTTAEALWWTKAITLNMARGMAESIGKSINDVANKVSSVPVVGWLAKLGGGGAEGAGKGISFALEDISSMINYLIVAMIVVGFTLGVVLPTIPLTLWLMGVISWMLFFIECLLVSPMWMAAHGTAEKEGWGSEHTRQGYMLMIGLYLNPILRVAGFFAIFVALKPIAWLVSWFFDYVQGVVVSGFAGLFILFGSVIICSIFAYSAMVRIFALPSELFERGLRWINGGQEVTGDNQTEKETRHTMAAFTSKGEGAAAHVKTGGLNKGSTPKPSAGDTRN
ncbi:MAG: DotA/TraY family protein [Pseudomonas balearica]|jgi:conjugal transfer/type IV secretion protein DotA/TraY|uniref:DotA/TraY family protein n=1 Tax=Stutzerimonas balearica TaxID=74829 RepID=UPI0019C138D6|nr:DotA/TraY family protein [Stutzerimonas balearica]MBC7198340.1 DotA/TraY family protein [Stutzerimonas balearica]